MTGKPRGIRVPEDLEREIGEVGCERGQSWSAATAPAARALGIDVISVHEVDRTGPEFTDHEQLRYAASERRVMVTRNRDDYIRLTRELFRTGEPHQGLLIIPHTLPNADPGRIARALNAWCEALPGESPGEYVIDFLSDPGDP